ncbi:MAG: 50S ribosomal protein L16 [archaeon]
MAKLRTARAYRRIKRPLTRHSKLRALDYVKGAPYPKVAQYDMGELTRRKFPFELQVVTAVNAQLRDTALEAGRQAAVRYLDTNAKGGWIMKVRAVPHHILREKPLATGAGADRFQQGMTLSYGQPAGHAAQVKAGKPVFSFYFDREKLDFMKEAARKSITKLPVHCRIKVFDLATNKEVTF